MPKQSVQINRFEGGLNNDSAERDLELNELVELKNLSQRSIGKLIPIVNTSLKSLTITPFNTVDYVFPGRGLLIFGLDKSVGSGNRKYYMIAFVESTTGFYKVEIYEDDGTVIPVKDVDYSTVLNAMVINSVDANNFIPLLLNFEGMPIAIDGNYNFENSYAKALVYVNRTYFSSSSGFTNIGWREEYLLPEIPTYSTSDTERSVQAIVGTAPIGSATWRIGLDITGTGVGTWDNSYNIYAAYILEDGTESGLTYVGSTSGLSSGVGINITAKVYVNPAAAYGYNSREIGIAFYIKSDQDDSYYFFAEALYESTKGLHVNGYNDGSYESWVYSSPTFTATYNGITDPIKNITYEMRNNTNPEKKISASRSKGSFYAKTAVVANRRVYYGNIAYRDSDLNLITKEDWVLKSEVGRPGSIDADYSVIEVIESDGEAIVKLETFANRLLEFKENTLYIINISKNIEYLEAKKENLGIKEPYQSISTEYGIVWFNKNGAYVFDGQKIRNLHINENRRVISQSEWKSFYNDDAHIVYNSRLKEVYFFSSISNSTKSGYVFSFDTLSWSKINSVFNDLYQGTNVVTDYDSYATFVKKNASANQFDLYKIDDESNSNVNIEIVTKDFDFGNDADLKNINEVLLVFTPSKSNLSGTVDLTFSYRTNGTGNYTTINNYIDGGTSQVTKKESLYLKNIRSIQFKLSGSVPGDFELNNISIIFRIKRGR